MLNKNNSSIFTGFLLLILFSVHAQDPTIRDGLLDKLNNSRHDTVKAMVFAELSKYYLGNDQDSAMKWAREGLLLSNSINYPKGMGELYACMGDIEVVKDSLNNAKDYYLESIKYFNEINDEASLTQVKLVLGNIYISQDNYFEALLQYQKALVLAEKYQFIPVLENLNNNIGVIYLKFNRYDDALIYFNRALEMSEKLGSQNVRMTILLNIGIIYSDKGDLKLAASYVGKAIELAIELNDKITEAICLKSLGDVELMEGNNEQALKIYFEALDCVENSSQAYRGPRSVTIAEIYARIGRTFYVKKDYKSALSYLHQCFDIAKEIGLIRMLSESSELLCNSYEAMGETSKAFGFHKDFKFYSDSLLNEDNIRSHTELEMQYKFDQIIAKKELEQVQIEAQRKKTEIIQLAITAGSVLSVVIVLLLYFLLRNKVRSVELKRKNLQLEKSNLTKELEHKNKELTTNVMYLLQKNEFIQTISEKLKKSRFGFKQEGRKIAEEIIRDLEVNLSTDTWKEFEMRFQEVHTEFYNKLIAKYPDLSPNELRLCAFLKLNMSTKEIAAITYLSANSINMARHRLRKKLDIDQDGNLILFLSSI